MEKRTTDRTSDTSSNLIKNNNDTVEDGDLPDLNIRNDSVPKCDETIASLLDINATEQKPFINLCGLSTTLVTDQDDPCGTALAKAADPVATCLFNDKHCYGFCENGLCSVHAKFRLAIPIVEYERNQFRIIHVPECDISNRQLVRIFPLLSFHRNLTHEDLQILNHNDARVLTDAVNYLVGITKPLGNERTGPDGNPVITMTEEKTEYMKKVIQFRDHHRPHIMKMLPYISKVNVYLYFTQEYRPQNEKTYTWFSQSQKVQNIRVHRIKLLDLGNIMDIYNILLYSPAKKIIESGVEVGYIPDVILLDGYICYGAGFGQSKLFTPEQSTCTPATYYIKQNGYLEQARKIQTLRVAPLTIDVEATHDSSVLIVLELKKQQTLSTKANILPHHAQYRIPAIEGPIC